MAARPIASVDVAECIRENVAVCKYERRYGMSVIMLWHFLLDSVYYAESAGTHVTESAGDISSSAAVSRADHAICDNKGCLRELFGDFRELSTIGQTNYALHVKLYAWDDDDALSHVTVCDAFERDECAYTVNVLKNGFLRRVLQFVARQYDAHKRHMSPLMFVYHAIMRVFADALLASPAHAHLVCSKPEMLNDYGFASPAHAHIVCSKPEMLNDYGFAKRVFLDAAQKHDPPACPSCAHHSPVGRR